VNDAAQHVAADLIGAERMFHACSGEADRWRVTADEALARRVVRRDPRCADCGDNDEYERDGASERHRIARDALPRARRAGDPGRFGDTRDGHGAHRHGYRTLTTGFSHV